MGLYGFKPQFWRPVLDGSKRHTIRCPRKHPDARGATMHMVGNPRRKTCFLLMRARCVQVRPIVLGKRYIEIAGVRLSQDERDVLAWCDGFRPEGSTATRPGAAFALMSEFWRDSELPLRATLLEWEYPPIEFGEAETLWSRAILPGAGVSVSRDSPLGKVLLPWV